MASLNKVMLIGNLTRDPEVKHFAAGSSVCEFGIAVNRKYRTKEGEEREEATFVECQAWDKPGETIAQYLVKGAPVFLEGSLTHETWEDKDGNKRSKTRVRVQNFQFLAKREDAGESAPVKKSPPAKYAAVAKAAVKAVADKRAAWREVPDEDIPF